MTAKGNQFQKKENKPPKDYLHLAYKGKEYLWMAFTVISVCISVYQLIAGSWEEALYFIALTFLSGIFYAFNKYRRKKFEKYKAEQLAS